MKGVDIVIGLIIALGSVFMPRCSWLLAKGDLQEYKKLNSFAVNLCFLIVIPAIALLATLSTPITTFVDRYEFNKETTRFILYPAGETTKKSLKQIKKLGFVTEPLIISYPLKKTEECKKIIEGAF